MKIKSLLKTMLPAFFFLLLISNTFSGAVAAYDTDEYHVLFISAYSPSYVTFDEQIEGIRSVFADEEIEMDIEYMDTKRYNTLENIQLFYENLKYKLDNGEPYDLIIAADDNALDFVMAQQETLFKEIPIVFLGINTYSRAQQAGYNPWVTGVVETTSVYDTIQIATTFNPDATNVVALVDYTTTGQGELTNFYEVEDQFPDLTFSDIDLSYLSFEEFADELEKLDDSYIVLQIAVFNDKYHETLTFNDGLELVLDHCNQPVYHLYSFGMGDGLIGGRVVNYVEQGATAAEMALRILQGENPADIPIDTTGTNEYMFDMDVLADHGINESLVPSGAVLLNHDPTFFELYGGYIILFILIAIVESALIIILFFNVRRRKKTEKNLLDNRGKLLVLNEDLEESKRKLIVYVEEIDKKNKQLYELTHIDPLTRLDNRPSIFSIIDDTITNNPEPLHTALLFLDIDNFKNINDTYGHDTGDQVIRVVGRKLKKLENEQTNVGRFGGDEFLILLRSQENTRMIIEFARQVLDIISEEIVVSSIRIFLTASVGIALFPKDCLDRITLVKKADTALYRAKELGRNRYAFYNEKLDEMLADKISLQTAINKAYKDKTFYLKYQPYIDIRTNRVAGVEALLRWENDEFKNVSAFALVRNIEEMGLMVEAGYEILRIACEFAKKINENRSHKIKMSVNVSAISLMHKGFYGKTLKIIHDTGVDPSLICLEMTETVLIKSLDESSDILTRLLEQNISIALDDFGTGYSSLRYLRELPVNVLKIDKTFIDNIEHNEYDQTIFNSMINIAHHRDIPVVAEGVESQYQVETLRKYECDVIQGYYFSRPLEPDVVIDFIDNYNEE